MFGTDPDSPNAVPGQIFLADDRFDMNIADPSNANVLPIDMSALHRTIDTTRSIIGYPTYDISLSLLDDESMRMINMETRDVDSSTDVLSFCFQDKFIEPGVLGKVQFDAPDYYNLGEMLIDVDYVRRRCEEDRKLHIAEKEEADKKEREGGGQRRQVDDDKNDEKMPEGELIISEEQKYVVDDDGDTDDSRILGDDDDDDNDDDDQYEYIEVEVDEYDDRGVAPAMQYVYDPEIRIHMLIVHGMLHLVGYDHIDDDDYEIMVVREDEVLAELRGRLGDDFGLARKSAPQALLLPEEGGGGAEPRTHE